MTRTNRRIKEFSSGITKLNADSRNYIQKLTSILFFVEQPLVHPFSKKRNRKINNARIGY